MTPSLSKQVQEFTGLLIRRFGTLKRAFRALKQAVATQSLSLGVDDDVLSKQEFMWCVSSFLHHGDQKMALKLFAELSNDEFLSENDLLSKDFALISLQELRQQLLEEFSQEELEQILRGDGREASTSARKAGRYEPRII